MTIIIYCAKELIIQKSSQYNHSMTHLEVNNKITVILDIAQAKGLTIKPINMEWIIYHKIVGSINSDISKLERFMIQEEKRNTIIGINDSSIILARKKIAIDIHFEDIFSINISQEKQTINVIINKYKKTNPPYASRWKFLCIIN